MVNIVNYSLFNGFGAYPRNLKVEGLSIEKQYFDIDLLW